MSLATELSPLLLGLLELVEKTGQVILDFYHASKNVAVQIKSDHSPCTQADITANMMLVAGLQKLLPAVPVLSEESSIVPWAERQKWSRYWLVDPLDGTRQFIQHSDEFVISIALIEQHLPILGVIHVPVTGESYYACANLGAHKLLANGEVFPLKVRPWQPNATKILASHGADPVRLQEKFSYLGDCSITQMGSAWKFCLVAEGKADLAPRLGNTSEWDTAAGQCIVEQAGGALLNWQGQPLRYNTKESLLNPHFIAIGERDVWMQQLQFEEKL